MGSLLDATVAINPADRLDPREPGRRLRVFARLVRCMSGASDNHSVFTLSLTTPARGLLDLVCTTRPTYGEALAAILTNPDAMRGLEDLPLVQNYAAPEWRVRSLTVLDPDTPSNPELPLALLDLANEIAIDIDEACQAALQPHPYYVGVDSGIPPVPDMHVALVCAALERELRREASRRGRVLPQLTALPFPIKRALVERRRWRFAQYGIGQAEWEAGAWSLWNVAEDRDWRPRAPRVSWG